MSIFYLHNLFKNASGESKNYKRKFLSNEISGNSLYYTLLMDEKFTKENERESILDKIGSFIKKSGITPGFELGEHRYKGAFKNLPLREDQIKAKNLNLFWDEVERRVGIEPILLNREIKDETTLAALFEKTKNLKSDEFISYCSINKLKLCLLLVLRNFQLFKDRGLSISDLFFNDQITTVFLKSEDLTEIYKLIKENKLENQIGPIILNYEEVDESYQFINQALDEGLISEEIYKSFINVNPIISAIENEPSLIYNTYLTAERSLDFNQVMKLLNNYFCKKWQRKNLYSGSGLSFYIDNKNLTKIEIQEILKKINKIENNIKIMRGSSINVYFKNNFPFNSAKVSKDKKTRTLKYPIDSQVQLKPGHSRTLVLTDSISFPGTSYYHDSEIEHLDLLFDNRIKRIENNILVSILLSKAPIKEIQRKMVNSASIRKDNLKYIELFEGFESAFKRGITNQIKLRSILE